MTRLLVYKTATILTTGRRSAHCVRRSCGEIQRDPDYYVEPVTEERKQCLSVVTFSVAVRAMTGRRPHAFGIVGRHPRRHGCSRTRSAERTDSRAVIATRSGPSGTSREIERCGTTRPAATCRCSRKASPTFVCSRSIPTARSTSSGNVATIVRRPGPVFLPWWWADVRLCQPQRSRPLAGRNSSIRHPNTHKAP